MTTAVTSPPASGLGGPVSAVLEADLRSRVRQRGIVVWLDQAGIYSEFVERLQALRSAGALPYQVEAFRGSHLALMMALDGVATGTETVPLVIHLPGFSEETVRQTPLFELYAAGVRYRKALDTLVTEAASGQARPDQISSFRAQPGMTLAGADAWLSALLDGAEGGIAAQLRAMSPTAVLDDLLTGGIIAGRIGEHDTEDALWERFAAWIGLPSFWRDVTLPPSQPRAGDVAFAAASWALCVEYTDDLRRAPANDHLASAAALPRPVIDACRDVAAHLREHHAGFYQRTADETEALLADEVEQAQAEDLGAIVTFRFEEDKVLKAALAALGRAAYDQAAGWADPRVEPTSADTSFWLRDDPARQSAWQLVHEAARLGQEIARAGMRIGVDASVDAAIETAMAVYAERGAAVDQAHRLLEQRRVALLYPLLPEFETLRARLDGMRHAWREWADAWAGEFNALCMAHGFLPGTSHQQRTLFDEVVRPSAQEPGATAYFVVDALRFEMGEELYRQMEGTPATTAALRPRLAELPTVTEVGMNVLAPVARNGRLQVSLAGDAGGVKGFQTGEFRVCDPETRKRAMHDRVGGATCSWFTLEEVVSRDTVSLKRSVSQARLVVVHSREIDEAGEKGIGPAVFDLALQKLRAAWRVLREAGVRRFVFTSDHGFLLLNGDTAAAQAYGRRIDPQRRHVFSPVAADHAGQVRVALADLKYEGTSTGTSVIFPESTAVFDTGRRPVDFAHGGNSLQERVIPVLTVVHRTAAGGSGVRYGVTAEAREGVAGMHCIEARVEALEQQSLDFGSLQEIELAVRVPDAEDVQVELCQARGKARIAGSTIVAAVGEPFELFFRLSGATDTRTLIEIHHPSAVADVVPCVPDARFPVTAMRAPAASAATPPTTSPAVGTRWLEQFPDPGIRQVFEHLAVHGAVTENEAAAMLGGPRGLRRFTLQFESYAQKAPFIVRIDVVAGVKRYVREGSA
ncbi:BREX-6 system phosphatase PglZ [Microtetraspora sp. AC03309]|uniref:BREX-6 system phosphatase PglZ n=1 Tax=Microtetraspora sp. AC03309 TaxID=2779376 RepID=UPI001E580AFB|nr:BREX-6 system phosphatase PglZ [Microtetraspora sp. AC03309]MCC5578210.1 BREX-6 system phosphatase PglZ [Microtetraspora sp. AC03309]